ncbi:MAG: hydrogenase small subunit [Anaerolineaceae bacterium]|nr:hydrogenase small subunit [Anaerolineaceae bacterium]
MLRLGESVQEFLAREGMSRRDFLKFCSVMASALALPHKEAFAIAKALESPKRLPVVWLELQDCAGCSEAFLRSSSPTAAELVLDVLSVDYHETIMAPSGFQAEKSKEDAIAAGGYVLVVEGSISNSGVGEYCCIAGKSSRFILEEAAKNAVAVIAVGNCATFGGIPAANPNPTGAVGVWNIVKDKPVVNIPGCPMNPANLTATVVHFLTYGSLPALDQLNRPLFAFGRRIHDNCERRGHFDAGEFVMEWGDDGHRAGWCLYKMGCKGPATFHNCPTIRFNDGVNWPIGAGHPCIGCSEPGFWNWEVYQPVTLNEVTPPTTYPSVEKPEREISPASIAISGTAVGAIAGAAGAFAYSALTQRSTHTKPVVEVIESEDSEEH